MNWEVCPQVGSKFKAFLFDICTRSWVRVASHAFEYRDGIRQSRTFRDAWGNFPALPGWLPLAMDSVLSVQVRTAERNIGITLLGTTLPPVSFKSLLAVINSSIPRVPISQQASLNPLASAPLLNSSSSTIPYFSQISAGMLICFFWEIKIGRLRRSDTTAKRVETWERVCEIWADEAWVGGRRIGRGPNKREVERGELIDRWDSRETAAGGRERAFACMLDLTKLRTVIIWRLTLTSINWLR